MACPGDGVIETMSRATSVAGHGCRGPFHPSIIAPASVDGPSSIRLHTRTIGHRRHTGAVAPPDAARSDPPKDRRFGQDVVVLVFVRFGAVAAGFLTHVLAARVLGATDLGAAGVALTVGSIAALIANSGLDIAEHLLHRNGGPWSVRRSLTARSRWAPQRRSWPRS